MCHRFLIRLKVGQTSRGAFILFTTVAVFSLGFPIPPTFFVGEGKGEKNTFEKLCLCLTFLSSHHRRPIRIEGRVQESKYFKVDPAEPQF